MSKHHSTVSRRDFLKILGLGGVGMGAAAVSAPVIHDLDELMASPEGGTQRQWYAREVDKPTIEIDWSMIERFDFREVMWAEGLKKALGPEQFTRMNQKAAENRKNGILNNVPGKSLKDVALNCTYEAHQTFLGPQTSATPESLGVPRWEGTPEENARLVRAAFKLHGASQVGFVELDTNTTEKLIYTHDSSLVSGLYPRLDILDVDQPSEDLEAESPYRVIPKKARWVIVYTLRMSQELARRPRTNIGGRMHGYMYDLKSLLAGQMQNFLRTLGYMCLGEGTHHNALMSATAVGTLAGLGEMARTMHMLTPEYGLHQRVFKMITDLPLAPGKPIDAGMHRFCKTCKKCADNCPVGALSHDTEPTWDTGGKPYAAAGIKTWYFPQEVCNAYMREMAACAVCFGVCPLSKGGHKAFYNDMQRWTTANTTLFNGFFRNMDDFLDYGWKNNPKEIEGFWDLDLPPFGYVD